MVAGAATVSWLALVPNVGLADTPCPSVGVIVVAIVGPVAGLSLDPWA